MDIKIRKMIPADVPAAAALERECFSQPWSENAYLDTLANENALYLVAENEQGKLIGVCGVLDILGEGDISNVAVDQEYRRRGVAKKLMSELLAKGRARGITEFILEVRCSNNAAIGLYEKFGFSTVGRRKGFYESPKEDALIMKL